MIKNKYIYYKKTYVPPEMEVQEVDLEEFLILSPTGTDDGMGGDPNDPNNPPTVNPDDPFDPFSTKSSKHTFFKDYYPDYD